MSFRIHDYVDSHAERRPDAAAIRFREDKLDYAGLAAASNRLAAALIEQGVRRHDRVGIYMDKSIRTPAAMYGIMKAGAAYVPIDPSAPSERVAALTRDCNLRHLISAPSKLRGLRALAKGDSGVDCVFGVEAQDGLPFRCVAWSDVDSLDGARAPVVRILESDLAYIIYTSGSTGRPKGIMHTHHSGLSFARWAAGEYGLLPEDRLSNHAPLHFDLSIFDYFAGVVAGAATVIIPEEHTKLAASYSQLLQDQAVTVLFTVPFALIQMLLRGSLQDRDLSALRWAIFGGEPFPPAHLRALMNALPHVKFDNMYGPAEVNGVTHYTVDTLGDDVTSIPIGPIAHSAEALVVDVDDAPVAAGEVGELLVRSPTMMRGYWQRDDLNAGAFYRRVNDAGLEEVFYRTGDLVEERQDGVFRFVGRKDRQIKVRGYRIELDEVESALSGIESVEEAAAYCVDDNEGSQEIRAEVTIQAAAEVTETELVRALKSKLPWYAVPASVRIKPEFPRTRTGKIDRRRLREHAIAAPGRARAAHGGT